MPCPALIRSVSTMCYAKCAKHVAVFTRGYRYREDVHGYKQAANVVNDDSIPSTSNDPTMQGVERLVEQYERHGHRIGKLNPLKLPHLPELDRFALLEPSLYGLELQQEISIQGETKTVETLVGELREKFCGNITLETDSMTSASEKQWLLDQFSLVQSEKTSQDQKRRMAELMVKSQVLDNFLATKFPTLKRYGGEGAESMLVFVEEYLRSSSLDGVEDVVIGMPHRGRNNLLVGLLNYPVEVMIQKIKGFSEFPDEAMSVATGDVLSHLSMSTVLVFEEGRNLHVNLIPNPSHLEAENTVAQGRCRGRQQTIKDGDYSSEDTTRGSKATCLLLHGDASFTGQGIVMEGLNMSRLPHFDIGGTVHLIVNNQVGFTTPPNKGRSSLYTSDIGKMIGCPVIHVNGAEPEQVLRAAKLAVAYRQKYRKEIIIDLLCFRRWGHNELDDPTMTQPLMYDVINNRHSIPDEYAGKLKENEILSENEIESWKTEEQSRLNDSFSYNEPISEKSYLSNKSPWGKLKIPSDNKVTTWDTGCNADVLRYVGAKSVAVPEQMKTHNRIQKSHSDSRITKLKSDGLVDWALAETLAFGSLIHQGYNIRLCGQDVGRGTFGHRHAMMVCQESGAVDIPLNKLSPDQNAHLELVNSLLSEEGVLGFEYGMSVEHPDRLVIWESQFGDFFNGAQIIFDTFISSGEAKWMQQSGLVVLLPHGYDGAGPEHSSCRIERFLQNTNSSEDVVDSDAVNMSVCHPTTSAQYFHLLRRQMIRDFRKPLVVASPKILLRLPAASSPMKDFESGTHFFPVIPDSGTKSPQTVKKVIFCSGKHYFALEDQQKKLAEQNQDLNNVAIVRIEELCPFPAEALHREVSRFTSAETFVWAQEEPRNMGSWNFVDTRFRNLLGIQLKYCGRPVMAAPAVGINALHLQQVQKILNDPFNL
ncbi:2-oxoadipate dehydrogenase complex component E1-like [Ciona intestinalis]